MSEPQDVGLIIAAAGAGERMGMAQRKPFLTIGGETMLEITCSRFSPMSEILQRVIVVHPEDLHGWREQWDEIFSQYGVESYHDIISGGASRCESVLNGLDQLRPEVEYVAIHDGARPFPGLASVRRCISRAREMGAAIVAIPVMDTLKRVDGDLVQETEDRRKFWRAQTPQVFERSLIEKAYREICPQVDNVTDDSQLVGLLGHSVSVVKGSPLNIKITTADDLALAYGIREFADLEDQ